MYDSGVLPGGEMWGRMQPAWEQKVGRSQSTNLDPSLHTLTSRCRDLELHRSLSLLLQHSSPRSDLVAMTHVLHMQAGEVARPQLAVNREIEHRKFTDV